MTFEAHWEMITENVGSFTPTEKKLAHLFYDFGVFDLTTKIRGVLFDGALAAIIPSSTTQGVLDERTDQASNPPS